MATSPPPPLSRRALLRGALATGAGVGLGRLSIRGALAGGGPAGGSEQQKPWNIVMLVSDEHNRKHMGCAGDKTVHTPNLDRLAREGVRLTQAYAASPVCAPSRVSLLTGLTPQQHGVYLNQHVLDERMPTFAEHFRKHGYTTAVIGKTHTNNPNATFGFDYWLGKDSTAFAMEMGTRKDQTRPQAAPKADALLFDGIADRRLRGAPIASETSLISGVVIDSVRSWLKEPKTQPFFLYASWTEPHHPWYIPEAYYGMYNPAKIEMPPWKPDDLADAPVSAQLQKENAWDQMTEAQHRLCLARYLGSVSYTDFVAGRILETLDVLGLAENTLVVYLSDHGDMASEKKMWLKGVMYDASAGIPMIVRMPGVLKAGTTADVLFGGVDLYPTLAGLVGAAGDLPPNLAGKDRSAQLLGSRTGEPEHVFSALGTAVRTGLPPQVMVRDRQHKLIRHSGVKGMGGAELRELYDMDQDPWETKNLAGQKETIKVERALTDAGDAWVRSLGGCPYPIRRVKDMPRGGSSEDPNVDMED